MNFVPARIHGDQLELPFVSVPLRSDWEHLGGTDTVFAGGNGNVVVPHPTEAQCIVTCTAQRDRPQIASVDVIVASAGVDHVGPGSSRVHDIVARAR